LLIYAGVMLRAENRTASLDVGMRTVGVFDVQTAPKYKAVAIERLRSSPLVEGIASARRAPLYGSMHHLAVVPSGSRNAVTAAFNLVSPEYFSVMRIPIVEGRGFSDEEGRSGAAVAVISQATAKRFWPNRSPLGESIALPAAQTADSRADAPPFASARVIGVSRDVASANPGDGLDPTCIYFPEKLSATADEGLLVSVRVAKEPGQQAITAIMNSIAPDAADQINPMDEVHAVMIYPFRVAFWICGFLAGLALVLTISGVYGVMSYVVSQRSKEIGIRLALGASTSSVARLVLSQSVRMAGVGAVLGGMLGLLAAPLLAHGVQAIQPYDPAPYAVGLMMILGASVGAALIPTRRALGIDPVVTLRCD
jgi:hypothetical protein